MPPDNKTEPSQQAIRRKRATSERVVPAIPLSLDKSKPAKPHKQKESDGVVEQDGTNERALNGEQTQEPTLPDPGQCHGDISDKSTGDHADSAVRMPTNGAFGSRPRGQMSISIGSTVETPTTPPPLFAEQPETTSTPQSASKLADKLDMRLIRTDLPPLAPTFVPSAEQHTPRSANSSHSNRPPSQHFNHAGHPSANGIMFGRRDSPTSSPAPPLSANSTFGPPQYSGVGHPPSFMPHGHAHHVSEPHSQRIYQPMYPQHAMPWNMRHAYSQAQAPYFNPHGHMAFRYPPRDGFMSSSLHQPNGRPSPSRSASQESSNGHEHKNIQFQQTPLSPGGPTVSGNMTAPEPKAAFPGHAHPRPPPLTHHMPPPPIPQFPPDVASSIENAEALQTHVLAYFNDQTFTDCRLAVTLASKYEYRAFDAHRVILSRSPTLTEFMQNSITAGFPGEVHIQLADGLIQLDAFTDALNYLYGGPLLQIDHHRPGSSAGERFPSNVERMEHALRYIATGAWLKLPPVAARGVDVASALLHWDTISTALAFALDGGLSEVWNVEDGSEDRASTSSSDDSLGRPEPTFTPTHDPYATNLLQRIVDFTVHVFPPNFYLDASAPQLESCPRLPSLPPSHESRPSRSDPRLSQIRFGEIPIEDHQRPSFATTTISSIMLSLPFQLLKCILEHYDLAARLGPETVASIMRQIVAERETRRSKVLKARAPGPAEDRTDAQLVQNLYWQESVEPSSQHRAGFRLTRRKRDIDTPPSSGASSERNK